MADENPSATTPPEDDSDKKETIRITLPPKSDEPMAKRETVRVNVPEQGTLESGPAPKKETSKVILPGSGATPPPMSRPSTPPAPPPLSRPLSGVTPPPKPPPFSAKPTVPLKPAPPAPPSGAIPPGASGVIAKPSSPKKETARISLPTDAPKSAAPALPKATVKMQQTQPLTKTQPSGARPPQSGITAVTTSASSLAAASSTSPAKPDQVETILSIVALVGSLAAVIFAFLVFKAAELPSWVQ